MIAGNISAIQILSLSPIKTLKSFHFPYKVNFDLVTLMTNLNHDHWVLGTNFNLILKMSYLVICRK